MIGELINKFDNTDKTYNDFLKLFKIELKGVDHKDQIEIGEPKLYQCHTRSCTVNESRVIDVDFSPILIEQGVNAVTTSSMRSFKLYIDGQLKFKAPSLLKLAQISNINYNALYLAFNKRAKAGKYDNIKVLR
jgi:hypothetical protein